MGLDAKQPKTPAMMAIPGSWSGAIIGGGLMFGIGMVLARGCSGPASGAGGHRQPALGGLRA